MPISGKEMLKLYLKAGWENITSHGGVRKKGSHAKVRKGSLTQSIPMHKELGKGLEKKLLKILNEQ